MCFPYVEGHKFYCEHWYTNLFFNKIREFGALLANTDFSRTEDVFQLTHYELEAAIIDLMTAWSTGAQPRGPAVWPGVVRERKAAIAEWAKHDTPPALGPDSRYNRRSGDRNALGDHARESRQVVVRWGAAESERDQGRGGVEWA